ncbi:M48 family metalloprotease [Fluviicola taffensis]|uniref:M48 family metalloprotease n=1 Tax=Fluviicola taffensis TaxID=191579 RepID=UPI003137827D
MIDEKKYLASILKHQRQAKAPKRWLWVIFLFYFVSIALSGISIFFLHMAMSELTYSPEPLDPYYNQLSALYFNLFLLIGLGLFVIVRYRQIVDYARYFISRHEHLLKEAKNVLSIYPILVELASKLNVSPDILILPTPSKTIFPSLERYRQKEVLILPVGFVYFQFKNPEQGRFILAHELSHIRQKDLQLFRQAEAYGKILLPLILAIQVLSLILKAFFLGNDLMIIHKASDLLISFGSEALTIICVLVAAIEVRRVRLNSEELADRGAALAVGAEPGISLFEYLGESNPSDDKTHPSPDERIKLLSKFLIGN